MLSSESVGHADVVLGALDDDLVGADAGHHVVDPLAPLVQAAPRSSARGTCWGRPGPASPGRWAGPRGRGRRGSRAGSCPRAPRRTGRAPASTGDCASRLKSCGRFARSCAMITQRPTIGSLRSSGIARSFEATGPGARRSSGSSRASKVASRRTGRRTTDRVGFRRPSARAPENDTTKARPSVEGGPSRRDPSAVGTAAQFARASS